jgi:alpha-1,3-rhamnosyl/mannosyltransferase
VFRAALAVALRVSSAILTPSRAAAADLRRHTASVDGRVTAIHSAVDPSFRPQPLEQVERTLANLHVPDRYVLYVGSNRPHKNLPRLIEAWARVDWCDGPLVVAGPWEESVPAARERVAELRLGGRVQFLGAVSEDDLRRLYTGATLFVFPSEYEGFGFPVLEAMSCGAAVACSNAGSLAEIADGTAELFPPHDVDAMATVLTSLLADANRRSDLAQRGLQRAASLTWEATSRQVLAVYRRVAGVTPSPSSNRPT